MGTNSIRNMVFVLGPKMLTQNFIILKKDSLL